MTTFTSHREQHFIGVCGESERSRLEQLMFRQVRAQKPERPTSEQVDKSADLSEQNQEDPNKDSKRSSTNVEPCRLSLTSLHKCGSVRYLTRRQSPQCKHVASSEALYFIFSLRRKRHLHHVTHGHRKTNDAIGKS